MQQCVFTDVRAKRKTYKKQRTHSEERVEDEEATTQIVKKLYPRQTVEYLDVDETQSLEDENVPFSSAILTDTSDNKIEVVPSSEVTHIITDQQKRNVVANVRFDTSYPLVSDVQNAHDKEEPLEITHKSITKNIEETFSELEPLQVTQVNVVSSVDEYRVNNVKTDNKAHTALVPAETIVTAETLINISVGEIDKDEKQKENARSTLILQDALNVSHDVSSVKEAPLKDLPINKSFAIMTISPLTGLNVTEVNEETKEHELLSQTLDKPAISKLNFNLHESVEIGEVFVEDRSGKYYPELIVPTEMAKQDVLVSNQIITEIHNVQEKEGTLGIPKAPNLQEVNLDITSKDGIVVSMKDVHEKEGTLLPSESPTKAKVASDMVLYSSLSNYMTTSHIKESALNLDTFSTKKAEVAFNEHQHTLNIETNVNDSENSLKMTESSTVNEARVTISALDKNVIEEIRVHESEKEFVCKDDKHMATANVDIKASEPIITSEIVEMASMTSLKTLDVADGKVATEGVVTESAKIVTAPFVHDQEVLQLYSTKTPENVLISLIPNTSISVLETKTSDSENKLVIEQIPEPSSTKPILAHNFKTPVSLEINTADQFDNLDSIESYPHTAREHRDLHKELTVLQTTVQEQLQKLDQNLIQHTQPITSFTQNESLNIVETIPTCSEKELVISDTCSNKFAKIDIDVDHKVPITSEVNLRDSLHELDKNQPQYREAEMVANLLHPINVSEHNILDSQATLPKGITPDLKSVTPEFVSVDETLGVSEIMPNEKEESYEKSEPCEVIKEATTNIISRPVAVSSEMFENLSVVTTECEDVSKKISKANIQNITFKEISVSTAEYNEKEGMLTSEKPKTVEALRNVDSNQAIIINDVQTEIVPLTLKPESIVGVSISPTAITSEAISQQEIIVHTSENVLESKEKVNKVQACVTLSGLVVPEQEEKVPVEKEDKLVTLTKPETHKVKVGISEQHGLETTEILSQCDNINRTDSFEMPSKKALVKVDEVYGKTASVEEALIIQSTAEIISNIKEQKPDIKSIEFLNLQQTETVLAESETVFSEEQVLKTNATTNVVEAQAIIESTINTSEKEKTFEHVFSVPSQDVSIEFTPHSGIMQSEIILSNNTESIKENTVKPEMKILKTNIEEQKSIDITEILTVESEISLKDSPKVKSHSLQPTSNISILPSVESSEVTVNERESVLPYLSESKPQKADYHLTPSLCLDISEEVLAEKESNLTVDNIPKTTINDVNFNPHHHINVEVYQTADVEESIKKIDHNFVNIKNVSIESIKALDVSEVKPDERIEELHISKTSKEEEPVTTIETGDHIDTIEIIPIEAETILPKPSFDKVGHITTNYEQASHVTVFESNSIEKEQALSIKSDSHPKQIVVSIETKPSVEIQEIVLTESETILSEKTLPKSENLILQMETEQHYTVTDTFTKEKADDLNTELIPESKEQQPNINTTHHIITSETLAVEDGVEIGKYNKTLTETAAKTHVLVEGLNREESQTFETFGVLKPLKEPQSLFVKKDIPTLKAAEHSEIVIQEHPGSLSEYVPTEEKLQPKHDSDKGIIITMSPQVMESTKQLPDKELIAEKTVEYELEVHKSYFTQENTAQEVSENLSTHSSLPKKAEEQIIELKGIEQIEIIAEEKPQDFDKTEFLKTQQAETIALTFNVVNTTKQEPLEDIDEFLSLTKPENKNAKIDVESHLSYTVTENTSEEPVADILKDEIKKARVQQEVLTLKPVEQTEIIPGENIESLTNYPTLEEKQIKSEPIQCESLNQMENVVHENEVETNFEKKISIENAAISLIHLTPLQCTENISETHLENLSIHETQVHNTAVKTNDLSPLIITDNETLQNETELKIVKPIKHKLKPVLNLLNELEITDKNFEEHVTPYNEVKPDLHDSKVILIEQNEDVSTIQEQINIGKSKKFL